jgi:DNA polymerase III epsilon subunit-like protein
MPRYLDYIHGNTKLANITWNVVDFETTIGRNKEPIEIGVIPIVNGSINKQNIFNSLIKPAHPAPLFLEESKVTADMLVDAPTIVDVFKEVRKRLLPGIFIEHSTNSFDVDIASNFFNINKDRIYYYSTLKLSRKLFPNVRNGHSLECVCRRLRVINRGPHRALHDALATAKVFLKMLYLLEENGVTSFAKFQEIHEYGFEKA